MHPAYMTASLTHAVFLLDHSLSFLMKEMSRSQRCFCDKPGAFRESKDRHVLTRNHGTEVTPLPLQEGQEASFLLAEYVGFVEDRP